MLFATTASTETFFTLVVLAGAALLLRAHSRDGGRSLGAWIAAGVAFGLAYHVRYAGLFLVLGLAALAFRHWVTRSRHIALGYAATFAAAMTLVSIGIARNVVLVGNWRGGNEKAVSNALAGVVAQTVRAVNGLVLGPLNAAESESLLPRALFGVMFLFLAVQLFRQRGKLEASESAEVRWRFSSDLLILVLLYSAFMFYAALTTVIIWHAHVRADDTPPRGARRGGRDGPSPASQIGT